VALLPNSGIVTWVNHYSVIRCINAGVPIERFDAVGIDGILLRLLSRTGLRHTSADFTIPAWLEGKKVHVGLIGGNFETANSHLVDFCAVFPNATVLWSFAGDIECISQVKNALDQGLEKPNLILVGMGAPLQEKVALELFHLVNASPDSSKPLIATCGGWLDQLGVISYYPKWATPLRLNWLVRLYREPRRLWKRYVLFPFVAIFRRKQIVRYLRKVRRYLGDD